MIDFAKELALILESDPLDLLNVKPQASSVISAEQRLLASFEEINAFVKAHGHEPQKNRDMSERRLYSRLEGLRNDPDNIAKRKPCKEFETYEPLFKQCHLGLASGKNELRRFMGEQQIAAGHFFVLHGVMVYVADVGIKEKKRGKVNARLRCIFENGTESNMLLRSLATELYKDESGRRVLSTPEDYLDEAEQMTEEDKPTGYIYILRSLSDDPKIKETENLFKIGFSTLPVTQRIKNAAQEPTYLMAEVRLLNEIQTFNLNPQKLELLLHTFFADACLNIDIFDAKGMRYTPREWFAVPLFIIETAIGLLLNGEIVHYRYDHQRVEIVEK